MKKKKDIHVGLCYKPMVLKLGDGYLFKGCFLAANPTWFTVYQTYILKTNTHPKYDYIKKYDYITVKCITYMGQYIK
jgi:hypothetical protein